MLLEANVIIRGLKPGQDAIEKVGGSHIFQNWDRNILTDSGGYVFI